MIVANEGAETMVWIRSVISHIIYLANVKLVAFFMGLSVTASYLDYPIANALESGWLTASGHLEFQNIYSSLAIKT